MIQRLIIVGWNIMQPSDVNRTCVDSCLRNHNVSGMSNSLNRFGEEVVSCSGKETTLYHSEHQKTPGLSLYLFICYIHVICQRYS